MPRKIQDVCKVGEGGSARCGRNRRTRTHHLGFLLIVLEVELVLRIVVFREVEEDGTTLPDLDAVTVVVDDLFGAKWGQASQLKR